MGLTGPLHVWFTPVWATLDLSGSDVTDDSCNDDIREARAYTFGVLGSDLVENKTSSTKLVSGQVGQGGWSSGTALYYVTTAHA